MAPLPSSPSPYPLLLLLLLLLFPATVCAFAGGGRGSVPYSAHCPASLAAPDLPAGSDDSAAAAAATSAPLPMLQLYNGYFSGGETRVFGPDPSFLPRSFSLLPSSVLRTTDPSLLHVAATLTVSGGRQPFPGGHRHLFEYGAQAHRFRPRLPRIVGRRGSLTFNLDGYYSSSSGELCMVGTGSGRTADGSPVRLLPVVLHARFPIPADLTHSFVTGRLEGAEADPSRHFEPVSLIAYVEEGYSYAESASCPRPSANVRAAHQVFEGRNFSCAHLSSLLKTGFRLDYGNGGVGELSSSSLGLHQRYMFVNRMHCADDGAVRAYVVFSNLTDFSMYYFMVDEKAAVVEGFWDKNSNRLCLKGCLVVNSGSSRADLAVGECGIGMSFWFPATWSIQERSFAAGLVWNTSLKSSESIAGHSRAPPPNFRRTFAGLKYNYTRVDEAKKYYKKYHLDKKRKGKFPDSNSYRDLTFRFYLQIGGGSGYASPVTIGSMLYDGNSLVVLNPFSHNAMAEMKQSLLNISYDIRYVGNWSLETFRRQQISAEGVYDTKTGTLCLVACRKVNASFDCEILVTAQFAPLDAKETQHIKGTIRSLRKKTDPLFFETLDIASYGMYSDQLDESIWRMDLESTMALISMTLSCVFIAAQLFHVKKAPEVLPAMSITMLVVLALGYMTPLVLNFEALFKSSSKQTFPLSDGGWLEVNEVMVRIITMVTFLLQLRLLQLGWSARSVDAGKDASWAAERKVIWICLPLYIIGVAVTWVIHMRFNHSRRMLRQVAHIAPVQHSFWEDLVAYGGLILDGFLLPQVILNVLSNSKVRALSPGFYIGSTIIRALPHVYDAFRAKHYVPSLRPSYMYASPRDDLYSLAWDIIIPCGAILLSVLLFFQQRHGGGFLLCSKNRRLSEYEMVSTASL